MKVELALYAKKHVLLDKPGWKQFKRLARREDRITRIINQAQLRSRRTATKFKYGFQVPNNHKEAKMLDLRNGDTKWHDADTLEMDCMDEYTVF